MNLPVSIEYLNIALNNGWEGSEMRLVHKDICELNLPSGRLVACDPFVDPQAHAFSIVLPKGKFPVVLSIAEIGSDQRVAFATVRLAAGSPDRWEMLTLPNQSVETLKPGDMFGYGVDSGTGCFMDIATAAEWSAASGADSDWYGKLSAEMEKTYRHTWSWLNHEFATGNLVAFASGYGDGFYGSYVGIAADGTVAVVVTDFGVVPDPAAPTPEPDPKEGPRSASVRKRGFWNWLFGNKT